MKIYITPLKRKTYPPIININIQYCVFDKDWGAGRKVARSKSIRLVEVNGKDLQIVYDWIVEMLKERVGKNSYVGNSGNK